MKENVEPAKGYGFQGIRASVFSIVEMWFLDHNRSIDPNLSTQYKI